MAKVPGMCYKMKMLQVLGGGSTGTFFCGRKTEEADDARALEYGHVCLEFPCTHAASACSPPTPTPTGCKKLPAICINGGILAMPVTFHLYVRNLAPEVTGDDLSEHFAAVGPVKRAFLAYPKGATSGVHRGFGFVLFALEADAQRAVDELSGSSIKGQIIKIDLALTKQPSQATAPLTRTAETQAADNDGSVTAASEGNKSKKPAPTALRRPQVGPAASAAGRPGRLIVRNLPFNCTQDVLRSVFAEFGTLVDVHVPTAAGKDAKPRCKGFAFVEFKTRSEGKTAVARATGVNVLGRPIAVDFAMGKREYCEKVGKEIVEEHSMAALPSKDDAAALPSKDDAEHQNIVDQLSSSKTAKKRLHSENSNTVKTEDERQDELERTVFVRNISYDSTEESLKKCFRNFGMVHYARLVKHHVSGQHKGCAFVLFSTVEAAIAAIETAQTASWETVGSKAPNSSEKMGKGRKGDDSSAQGSALDSILLQGAGGSEGISCDGRLLLVTTAISRTAAADVNANKKEDRRNMRLAKEGVILRGSPEAAGLSAADLDRREASWNEKKKRLQNPNFFVSNTRVSVRNLAKEVDSKTLKDFFVQASSGTVHGTKAKGKGKQKVLKAKLVTELNSKGEPVSKGFGFVEFDDEETALKAIRTIVDPASPMLLCGRRPMVEFSIENIQVVRLKKIRSDRLCAKVKAAAHAAPKAPVVSEPKFEPRKRRRF